MFTLTQEEHIMAVKERMQQVLMEQVGFLQGRPNQFILSGSFFYETFHNLNLKIGCDGATSFDILCYLSPVSIQDNFFFSIDKHYPYGWKTTRCDDIVQIMEVFDLYDTIFIGVKIFCFRSWFSHQIPQKWISQKPVYRHQEAFMSFNHDQVNLHISPYQYDLIMNKKLIEIRPPHLSTRKNYLTRGWTYETLDEE